MIKPFIILALPRTGTKMFADAISSHPDIVYVKHEFKGTEAEYWQHPYVLSNTLEDWMLNERITRIHLYREDSVAGAQSLLLMSYVFPDKCFDLPLDEVADVARFRRETDAKFLRVSALSVSYEALCGGQNINRLPSWFVRQFSKLVGARRVALKTAVRKQPKLTARNQAEVECLRE